VNGGRCPGGLKIPGCDLGSSTCIIDSTLIGVDNPPSAWGSAGSSTSSELGLSLEDIGLSKVKVEVLGRLDVDLQDTVNSWGTCSIGCVGLGSHQLSV
jgi:hypothetical protein